MAAMFRIASCTGPLPIPPTLSPVRLLALTAAVAFAVAVADHTLDCISVLPFIRFGVGAGGPQLRHALHELRPGQAAHGFRAAARPFRGGGLPAARCFAIFFAFGRSQSASPSGREVPALAHSPPFLLGVGDALPRPILWAHKR